QVKSRRNAKPRRGKETRLGCAPLPFGRPPPPPAAPASEQMPPYREGSPSTCGVSSLPSLSLALGTWGFHGRGGIGLGPEPLGNDRIYDATIARDQRALDELVVPIDGEVFRLLVVQRL